MLKGLQKDNYTTDTSHHTNYTTPHHLYVGVLITFFKGLEVNKVAAVIRKY